MATVTLLVFLLRSSIRAIGDCNLVAFPISVVNTAYCRLQPCCFSDFGRQYGLLPTATLLLFRFRSSIRAIGDCNLVAFPISVVNTAYCRLQPCCFSDFGRQYGLLPTATLLLFRFRSSIRAIGDCNLVAFPISVVNTAYCRLQPCCFSDFGRQYGLLPTVTLLLFRFRSPTRSFGDHIL